MRPLGSGFGKLVTPFAPPFSTSQLFSIARRSLTLQFGMPIKNDPTHPFGIDFQIFGIHFRGNEWKRF